MQARLDEADRRVAQAEATAQRYEQITVKAWSPGKEARVTIDSSGLLSDIEFSAVARRTSPQRLARAVIAAHDTAIQQWGERVREFVAEEYRHNPAEGEAMLASVERMIPARVK